MKEIEELAKKYNIIITEKMRQYWADEKSSVKEMKAHLLIHYLSKP